VGKLSAAIEGFQDGANLGFRLAPSYRMRKNCIEKGIRVIRTVDFHIASKRRSVNKVEKRLNPAPVRVKKILEWFRHGSQLLKCPLSPSIVDESFLASLQLHGKIGR
jgi:hypothetical protein